MSKPQTRLAIVAGALILIFFIQLLRWLLLNRLSERTRVRRNGCLIDILSSGSLKIFLQPRSSYDVGKHTGCSHFRTGTGPFYYHWLLGIAVGIKRNDVVLAIQMIKV